MAKPLTCRFSDLFGLLYSPLRRFSGPTFPASIISHVVKMNCITPTSILSMFLNISLSKKYAMISPHRVCH